jgi:hypothetical protein
MIDANDTKRIYEEIFEKRRDDPEAWIFTAMKLRRAAEILFEANETSTYEDADGAPVNQENAKMDEPATLLYAHALEDALKGYLIKMHGGFKQAKDSLPDAWKTHRLSAMAEATGLPLSKDQALIIQSIEQFSRWAGKYPTSLRKDDFTLPQQFYSGRNLTPNALDSTSLGIIDAFYEQLKNELLADFRSRWTH